MRIRLTLFKDFAAASKREVIWPLKELGARIRNTTAPRKAQLPWLKLARFGDQKTDKGSLRHDGNMLAITGVEADYDGEKVPFDTAVETAAIAGVLVIAYTSPSNEEVRPRWRVLCPTSKELPPDQRDKLMGRLNGLFGGIFAPESWVRSQSYYFGSVNQNADHRVEIINGTPIDELSALDECWLGRNADQTEAKDDPLPSKSDEQICTSRSRVALSKYGEAALGDALRQIINAPPGQQRSTLNREAYGIGQLVEAGEISASLAISELSWAAGQVRSLDGRRPWHAGECKKIAMAAYLDGQASPRRDRRHG